MDVDLLKRKSSKTFKSFVYINRMLDSNEEKISQEAKIRFMLENLF